MTRIGIIRLNVIVYFVLVLSLTIAGNMGAMQAKFQGDWSRHDEKANCKNFGPKFYPAPKRINQNCYTGRGRDFRGTLNVSRDGRPCMNWRKQGDYYRRRIQERRRYGIGDHNFCRNPDQSDTGGPWCFVDVGVFSRCNLSPCKNYQSHDPLRDEPTQTCDRKRSEFIFPDVMYQYQGKVHYAVKNNRKSYDVYKFLDGNMTSLDEKPHETTAEAWDFCTQYSDTLTFVSSYDEDHLYAYFERPNVMIRVEFTPNPRWEEVPHSKHEQCTKKAEPTFSRLSYTSIRQVFSVKEPNVVLLLSNDRMIRCEWRDGVLMFVNSSVSPFGTCPSGSLHFIDGHGKLYQLYGSLSMPNPIPPSTKNIVRSTLQAVQEKPALAFALLGYGDLNKKSLVSLRSQRERWPSGCKVDGERSRVFQLYHGHQIDDIIPWIERTKEKQAWLRLHVIDIRKSSFCEEIEFSSCCTEMVEQVLQQTVAEPPIIDLDDICTNEIFLSNCKVSFVNITSSCPSISCGAEDAEMYVPGETVICEIPMADDPPCYLLLDEILSSSDVDGISYQDAMDALSKMDTIAATLIYQNRNDSKVLSKLVDSVQALEMVDYSSLSRSGAENLISDVIDVVHNIVDDETADVWVTLQEENEIVGDTDTSNTTHKPMSGSTENRKVRKPHSVSRMLFTMESVLEGIVAGQVSNNNTSENSNFTMSFHTKNIISNIQSISDEDTIDIDGSFVKFDTREANPNTPRVSIVTRYPKLMQLISRVDQSKSDNSTYCVEKQCPPHPKVEYISHSPVVSASVMEKGHKVSSGITFAIPYTDEDIPDAKSRDSKFYFSCRYLTETQSSDDTENWNDRGCKVSKVDHDKKLVYCTCNHTTNFAILLQVVPPKIKKQDLVNLQIISYIGESISVLCLFITLTTFVVLRHSLKSPRMVAHFHLVIALIIFHMTQLMASIAEKQKNSQVAPCVAVAVLTHFSLLASFCWMLVEGILLYMSVVSVFHSKKYMKVARYVIGWVFPGVIAGVTIVYGLTRNRHPTCYLQGVGDMSCPGVDQNGSDHVGISGNSDSQPDVQLIEWCWLSSSNYLIWAMAAPAMVAIAANTFVLFRVSIVIARSAKATNMYRPTTERKKEQHIRKCLKGAFILMPILGVPWLFGLIPQAADHVAMLYVFTLFNSIQGFFILLFYCILSSEVRSAFNRILQRQSFWHSQNSTTHTSGRHSFAEHRTEKGRKKSRPTSISDMMKDEGKSLSTRKKSLPSNTQRDKNEEALLGRNGDNNIKARRPKSETSL